MGHPGYPPAAQQQSAWPKYVAIGCIAVLALAILAGVGGYYAFQYAVGSLVENFTSDSPLPAPEVTLPPGELSALRTRVETFGERLETGTAQQPLELSADEINALIQDALRDTDGPSVYVRILGHRVTADVSIPVGRLQPQWEGRYLNGEASLSVNVENGRLVAYIEDLKVGGERIPDSVREKLRRENLLKDAYKEDDGVRRVLSNLKSVEIRDGKVILTPVGGG